METKFQIDQVVYSIQDYRIDRVRIEEVIIRNSKEGQKIHYSVVSDLGRKLEYDEALLVGSFEEARQAAATNWDNIDKKQRELLNLISDKDFDERKRMYEEKTKGKNV